MYSDDQLIEAERKYSSQKLSFFRKRVCGYKDFQPFHDGLDNVLQSNSRYKMIMIPRNHLKSSAVMSWILHKILHNPDLSILYESSVYAQAKKYLAEMRGHLESQRWKSLYGNWQGSPWTDSAITVNQRTKLQPAATISASGLDKTQTGQHYDLIVLDDLVDELNSKTSEGREKAIARYQQALSLLRPGGSLVLVGTPWDRDDLYGWIQKKPAILAMFEVFKMDVYDDSGKIIFHQKFCETIEDEKSTPHKRSLQGLRLQLGAYQFSCQYRVNPDAEEFSEFKRSWLKHSKVSDIEHRLKYNRGKVCIFVDPAMGREASRDACDTAIIVGHFMEGGFADVIDHEVGLYTPGDTINKVHHHAMKYLDSGSVDAWIEDVGYQGALIQFLEKKRNESGSYYGINAERPTGDKDRRIRGLFPFYQAGQITHSEAIRGKELENQLERFPKDRKKDAIDAWSQFTYNISFPLKSAVEKKIIDDIKPVFYTKRAPKVSEKKESYQDKSYMGNRGDFYNIGT